MSNTEIVRFAVAGWHYPEDLRAGDLIHVDERTLSVVVSHRRARAGTETITLNDGREIAVCGGTRIAVFA
jgi:phosphoribosylamine-glycine ligase